MYYVGGIMKIKEIRFETFINIDPTMSAIRAIHLPTGIEACCDEDRRKVVKLLENKLMITEYCDILIDRINWMKDNVDFGGIAEVILNADLVLTAGNGGSSATASHLTNDLFKMAGINSICLTDSIPLLTAFSNDISYENALMEYYNSIVIDDASRMVVIVFSGSGNSENVVRLATLALRCGSTVIAVTGYDESDNPHRHENLLIKAAYNRLDMLCATAELTDDEIMPGKGISVCFHVNDMQIAEDLHLIWSHILLRTIVGEEL